MRQTLLFSNPGTETSTCPGQAEVLEQGTLSCSILLSSSTLERTLMEMIALPITHHKTIATVLPNHRCSSSRMWPPDCRQHMQERMQMPSRARSRRCPRPGRHYLMHALGAELSWWTQQTSSASSAWFATSSPGWRASSGR